MLTFDDLYQSLRKRLHYVYLVYAIPMVCLTAIITPPFQSPDEPNHFARAEQVSRLEMVPVFVYDKTQSITKIDSISKDPRIVYPDKGGFAVDKGIYELDHAYINLEHSTDAKITQNKADSVKNLKWKTGIIYFNFGNTAIYPPIVYLMQALGISVGKLLHLSIIKTLYLSRILNGLLSITLCFFALLLAKRSGILLFIMLLFPMAVSLFASVSQDAVLISCCFLLTAIIDNVEFSDDKNYSKRKLCVMIMLMAIIGVAKPPYIIFIFLFLFLNLSPKLKAISIITSFLVLALWLFIDHGSFMIKFAPAEMRLNSKLQILHILHHPLKFIMLFFDYDKVTLLNVAYMFIGILGWLDLQLSDHYYRNAYICLFLGIIVSLNFKGNTRLRIALIFCAFTTLIAVISAQYVTWAPLEAPSLGGMQGRYLIPIFPFLALALCGRFVREKFAGLKTILLSAILIFPIVTTINMVQGLLNRYY
jgi:uncharacterized membrane protein